MNNYDIGDVIRLQSTFVNSAGVPVDPSSVSLQYRRYMDAPSSYVTLNYPANSITKVSTGVYFSDVTLTQEGE